MEETARPLLLLDIDGVLNPYAAEACPEGYEEHILFPGEEPIRVCATHAEWLRELSERFEIVWASGWGADAHVLGRTLTMPDWPIVVFPAVPFEFSEKLPAIAAYAADRPAAWVDDNLDDVAREWAAGRAAPTLLIATDPAVGLQRGHVVELLRWSAALGS